MGIISGAMSGGGEAALTGGRQIGEYLKSSALQKEAFDFQRERDQWLDELKRAPGKAAASDIQKARETPVDDPSGTMRPRNASELATAEQDAYLRQGLVGEAMQSRQLEQQRERDNQAMLDRNADNNRGERQLDLQRQQFDVTKKGADLDHQIKQFQLANVQRVEALKKEFGAATPERQKSITEEIQLITGKDNDNFLPVPFKDDMGNIVRYDIFDKKRGEWVQPKPPGAAGAPSQADIEGLVQRASDPRAVTFFESKFGKGSAQKYLSKPKKPTLPGDRIIQSQRGEVEPEQPLEQGTFFGAP